MTLSSKGEAAVIVDNNEIDPDDWWVYVLVLAIGVAFRLLAVAAPPRRAQVLLSRTEVGSFLGVARPPHPPYPCPCPSTRTQT